MRLTSKRHAAELVRLQRVRLEELAGEADPAAVESGADRRVTLQEVVEQLERAEAVLRGPRRRGSTPGHSLRILLRVVQGVLRRFVAAAIVPARFVRNSLMRRVSPRIGVLSHHRPKPLRLPLSYWVVDPPPAAPTISIVTPSFQHGRFLERTLYSVVSQHYPALEYFVQDGGSSDETLDVLQRFDHLLSGWASEPDAGQADAINRAFARTSGEIMAWLNSDDLLLPGTLAYVATYFSEHPDVDVVYGHRLLIDRSDRWIGSWILPAHDDTALALADYVPQETLFWRRRIWDAVGGVVDVGFGYALDWDLLLRMRADGAKMVRLPRFLGAFRIYDEQKTVAENELGLIECMRLRERVHGRGMSIDEVTARLFPYLLRHIAQHALHQLTAPFRRPRRRVRTTPYEPWLRSPAVLPENLTPLDGATAAALSLVAGSALPSSERRD